MFNNSLINILLNYNVLSGDEEEEERCNCRDQEEQER